MANGNLMNMSMSDIANHIERLESEIEEHKEKIKNHLETIKTQGKLIRRLKEESLANRNESLMSKFVSKVNELGDIHREFEKISDILDK